MINVTTGVRNRIRNGHSIQAIWGQLNEMSITHQKMATSQKELKRGTSAIKAG
jgi:hypothetical protein